MNPINETEVVLLEDPDGRLVTYATVRIARLPGMPLMWRDRVFRPFGSYRPPPDRDLKPGPLRASSSQESFAIYREYREHPDGNDPITVDEVIDRTTPRTRP